MSDNGASDAETREPAPGHWGGLASPAADPVQSDPSPAQAPLAEAPPGPTFANPGLRLTLVLLLVWMLVTLLGGVSLIDGVQDLGGFMAAGVAVNIAASGAIALVAGRVLGLWPLWFGAPLPGTLRATWFPMLFLGLLALVALLVGWPGAGVVLVLAANCLFVGISEEVMFRGLFYRSLRGRMGILSAALLSSLLFGAIHVLNALLTGDLVGAVAQSTFAALLGLVLAAMMLRSGSLFWPILYHAVWDFCTLVIGHQVMMQGDLPPPQTAFSVAIFVPALVALPMAIHAFWLIRRLPRHAPAMVRA